MWPLKAAFWSTKLLSKHVVHVSTCLVLVYTKRVQNGLILLSPTCRIAGQNSFFLSVLIEQLSKTSKDNGIHDTIQSTTESNINIDQLIARSFLVVIFTTI